MTSGYECILLVCAVYSVAYGLFLTYSFQSISAGYNHYYRVYIIIFRKMLILIVNSQLLSFANKVALTQADRNVFR